MGKPPESESWKPVEKSSLWTSSLNKLHWDRTLFFSKDPETPEKLSSTEARQVPQRATPNLTFDLLEGNSNEHEVDELPRLQEVNRLFSWFISWYISCLIIC